MSNTPELTEDIKKEIALESEDYANKRYKYRLYPNEWMAAYNAHHAGATAMYEKLKAASQPIGAVWVKASERLPEKNGLYCFRANGGYMGAYVDIDKSGRRYVHDSGGYTIRNWKEIEWLDETPSPTDAGNGKEDAVAFIAAVTEEGAEMWKMEYDSCRKILEELVDLKDIKDREGKTDDYLMRQPVAWVRAKRFLEKYQHINW